MFVLINLILVIHRADSSAPIRLLVVSNFFFLPQHLSLRSRFRSSFSHPWLRVFRRLSCNSLLAPRRFDTEGVRERERERERGGGEGGKKGGGGGMNFGSGKVETRFILQLTRLSPGLGEIFFSCSFHTSVG